MATIYNLNTERVRRANKPRHKELLDDREIEARLLRIRNSIVRINALMSEIRNMKEEDEGNGKT